MNNAINWFEIPAIDFERAVKFYNRILNLELRRETLQGRPNGVFTASAEGVGGAVVQGANYTLSASGIVIYLDTDGKLDEVLSRVEAAGGKIILPKTHIGPQGDVALLIDTEGNRVGLHQESGE